MDTNFEDRIRRLEWPAPPEALRARILTDAMPVATPVTWADRLWFSRTLRWSVAMAAVALVAVGQWSGSSRSNGAFDLGAATAAEVQALQEIVVDAGLPSDLATELVRRAIVARDSSRSPGQDVLRQLEREWER